MDQLNIRGDTVIDMLKNMDMKLSLIQTLDLEYKNSCRRLERHSKEIEETGTKLYDLLLSLNASECRLSKYSKKEEEWKNEILCWKKNVDEYKNFLDEARKLAHDDDVSFDQSVVKLVENRQKDRIFYDSNTTKESFETLLSMDRSLAQETVVLENMLKEEKTKDPFTDSDEVKFILKNSNLSDSINQEMNYLLTRKNECLIKLNDLKERVRVLEEEINLLNITI